MKHSTNVSAPGLFPYKKQMNREGDLSSIERINAIIPLFSRVILQREILK